MSRGRRAALLFPLVSLTVIVAWAGAALPPPGLLLEFGRWPGARTTGRTRTLSLRLGEPEPQDVEFVELSPGYVFVDRHAHLCERPIGSGRILRPLGLAPGPLPSHCAPRCRNWAGFERPLWIARSPVGLSARDFQTFESIGVVLPQVTVFRDPAGERIRLVTQREYDYACLAGAVPRIPHVVEMGTTEERPPNPVQLTRPDIDEYDVFWIRPFHARIVWIPDE